METSAVEQLHARLLGCWNGQDAAGFASLFTADGSMVGFDGSCVESSAAIAEHIGSVFADHQPASYVAIVREVRELGPGVALLRAVVGMVPPGGAELMPEANAVQSMVAVDGRVAHFHNTPAAFHGRPEEAEALTVELRAALAESG